MNKLTGIILAVLLLVTPAFASQDDIDVYFSPHGGATNAIVRELNAAKKEILVMAYSFTSVPIAQALVSAHRRGVSVMIVLDQSQRAEKYSSADFVAHAGIATYIDSAHKIQHNKTMVIDQEVVITGSFNFSKAAEQGNAENLLIIKQHPDLCIEYIENFTHHAKHSAMYRGR